ncbi:XPG i-region domain-containing protein [Sarocladium implicatum]|nr:XPG i-region domain-containing protein [Sarocladium implicatum]
MGVSGLLPLLKSIQKRTEIKKYNGLTLGVDVYGWLHRAAHSCAVELGQGQPTTKYISGVMHKVKMLQHFGITPYMVFDGGPLPSKAGTEESRAKSRTEKKKLAMELLRSGKASQAAQEFQKCIDITPEMASAVIQQLKQMNVPYVVAPFEADSQLVYLEKHGLIDGIISEDSDLLVFGAKRLITKLDQYGNCVEINRRDFCACREVSLTGWSDTEFRRMAIMSGCDYLEGLPSVGLKTAYRMLRKSKDPERCVKMLQFQGKRISENYLTQFYQAELTFLHQWVFCPKKQEIVHLTELDGTRTAEEMPFIGSYIEPEIARAIAQGDMNPITKLPIARPMSPSKRRHSQMGVSVPAQPPAKPVNSYFKGHSRIPMGAMDPNCFNIDRQRVAQLTDGGLVPRVFPLPRPYLDDAQSSTTVTSNARGPSATRTSPRLQRRRTEPISNMLSRVANETRPQGTKVAAAAATPHRTEASIRPSKKPRLCDDIEIVDISPEKSKFFGAKSTSTAGKSTKSTNRSKSDATLLLSDDSINEALLSLPDIEGWSKPKSKKSISIFDDSSVNTSQAPVVEASQDSQDTAQTSLAASLEADSQVSLTTIHNTPPSSPEVDMPPPKAISGLGQKLKTPATNLRSFSYTSSSSTVSTVASRRDSIFSAVSTPSTGPSTAATSRMTPLQRLGARALNHSPRPPAYAKEPAKRKNFLNNFPVNPALVALPKVDLDEVEALNRPLEGSEDQIIPDSDGEDEEALEAPPRKLNLSQFAYT